MRLVADVPMLTMRVTDVPPLAAPEVGESVVTVGEGAVLRVISKLSKTFPGGFVSTCEVSPLSSERIDEVKIEGFQFS